MAVIKQSDSQIHPEIEIEDVKTLKHLEFVQVAAVNTIGCLSSVYDYAKKNSGPLKSGVENVEGTVKTVVKPVYEKFYDVPIEVLKFVDGKVGESIEKVNNVHSQVKQVSGQAVSAAQKAPTIARSMASDVHRAGVETASGVAKSLYVKYEPTAKELYSKYEPTAKELYSKYEPVAEKCAVSTWRKLNQLPLFPKVAQVVVPAAAYCTETYNQTVESTAEKGYKVSSYLPLVPTEKIAKIFSNDRDLSEPLVSGNANIEVRGQ